MPPTHYPHAEIIQNLIAAMVGRIDKSRVAILGSNFGLMISRDPLTCRSPDLALYWRDKMTVQDGLYWSPPGLVVEIISPSETKRRKEDKLSDYARIGVPEVWLIAPEGQTVEVRLLKNSKLVAEKVVLDGMLQPSEFPGISIPVAEIWPPDLP
jgi:Uma2 family endonuclease